MKSDFKKIKGTLRGEIKQLKKRIPDISIDKDYMEYTHRREVEKLKASVQKELLTMSHTVGKNHVLVTRNRKRRGKH